MMSDYILIFAGWFLIIYVCSWLIEKEKNK